jgi:hypothetical protein
MRLCVEESTAGHPLHLPEYPCNQAAFALSSILIVIFDIHHQRSL